jgi:hypothetical protein
MFFLGLELACLPPTAHREIITTGTLSPTKMKSTFAGKLRKADAGKYSQEHSTVLIQPSIHGFPNASLFAVITAYAHLRAQYIAYYGTPAQDQAASHPPRREWATWSCIHLDETHARGYVWTVALQLRKVTLQARVKRDAITVFAHAKKANVAQIDIPRDGKGRA